MSNRRKRRDRRPKASTEVPGPVVAGISQDVLSQIRRTGYARRPEAISEVPGPVMAGMHRDLLSEMRREGYARDCEECGTNLYPEPPEPFGFFMLKDPVWNVVSLDGRIKCLCLGCTEEVLGTRLPSFAFDTTYMAPTFLLTPDLRDRLDPATDGEFQMNVDEERGVIARREFPTATAEAEDG